MVELPLFTIVQNIFFAACIKRVGLRYCSAIEILVGNYLPTTDGHLEPLDLDLKHRFPERQQRRGFVPKVILSGSEGPRLCLLTQYPLEKCSLLTFWLVDSKVD